MSSYSTETFLNAFSMFLWNKFVLLDHTDSAKTLKFGAHRFSTSTTFSQILNRLQFEKQIHSISSNFEFSGTKISTQK